MRRSNWLALVLALGTASNGCSAIVAPNTGRLYDDANNGGIDSGPQPDTGVPLDTGASPDVGSDAPGCPADCSDGIACTDDACAGTSCTHVANDALCPGERCNPGTGCVPIVCTSSDQCDDGNVCNGIETCVPGSSPTGCITTAPLDCNDGIACTIDTCDRVTGCAYSADHARCADDVPCTREVCELGSGCRAAGADDAMCNVGCRTGATCGPAGCTGGTMSCDDGSPCTTDSCDSMMCRHTPIDADGDTFPAASASTGGMTVVCGGGSDCDDSNAGVHPGATELCNGRDDNCDGRTDEGCAVTGETCADPIPLTLTGGSVTVSGTIDSSRRNDYDTRCGGPGGRDVVYVLTLDRTSDVRIETRGPIDTIVAAGTTCDLAGFGRQCNDDENPETITTSRMWLRRVQVPIIGVQQLYIVVDGYSASTMGSYQLNVQVSPMTAGDSCGGNPLNVTGGGTVYGNMSNVTGSHSGSCQMGVGVTQVEALFRYEGPRLQNLTAVSSDFNPSLYVRRTCSTSGTEVACTNGTMSGGGGTATLADITSTATALTFFVDNAGINGAYRLEIDP